MNGLVEKLAAVETSLAAEKGRFNLFAAFEREESRNLWDIVVSAPWVSQDRTQSIRLIAQKIQAATTPLERRTISRVAAIEPSNPALEAIRRAVRIEHGGIEITDINFFGLKIRHAFIITARSDDA